MKTQTEFPGFPAGMPGFLRRLEKNNNREWFAEHREEYSAMIVEPSRDFVLAMGERLERDFPNISYDTRMNGTGSMMRMARDTRFRRDKTPYRTDLGFFFWEGEGHKRQCPGIFVRLGPGGGGVYAGKWMFPEDMLRRYREAVADDSSGRALIRLLKRLEKNHGLEPGGAQYKRVPRPYPQDHPRGELLRNKGLHMALGDLAPGALRSSDLVETCASLAKRAAPLHRWLVALQ